MRCSRCSHEAPAGAAFCPDCGTKLAAACARCGTPSAAGQKFCTKCGASLTAAGESEREPVRSPAAAERRQLTVMFCDLVGSTAVSSVLDPEEMRELIRAYQDTCGAVIARFEGHVAQYLGDGLLVYFGYPQAHEDDPRRAVRAALEMVEAIERSQVRPRPDVDERLAVRVGIHTGLVVVGEIGGGERLEHLALGETPNLAARVQALAAPGTVVVSDATHRLAERAFRWQDLGPRAVKGFVEAQRLWQAIGEVGAGRSAAARAHGARFWELRAAVALARLLEGEDRRDAARSVLTPALGGFEDARDLPEIGQAIALLDRLRHLRNEVGDP